MPPSTPVYGFPFEDADDQPGISLTGGSGGLSPILAEEVETELIRIEGDIGALDARVTALETPTLLPQRDANTSTFTPLTNTTYAATGTPVGISFVAPPSGRGLLACSARLIMDVTANVARLALGTPWLGAGGTINGGAAVSIEDLTPPHDQLAFIISRNHTSVSVDNVDSISSDTYLVDGLTPGNTYNASLRYRTTNASNMFYAVERQRIRWMPDR